MSAYRIIGRLLVTATRSTLLGGTRVIAVLAEFHVATTWAVVLAISLIITPVIVRILVPLPFTGLHLCLLLSLIPPCVRIFPLRAWILLRTRLSVLDS
ncbi:hypothetical protein C8R43DRAFT_238315 [Mycena crocata]|nr:hypothetical protein C8R43DRAFT_238315 [Mycena crocata]